VTRYTALFGTELAAKAEAIGAEFDKLRTAVAAAVTAAEAEMDRTAAEIADDDLGESPGRRADVLGFVRRTGSWRAACRGRSAT